MGRFYILALENECSSTSFTKNLFEEVWQYGSNEREITTKSWELDGLAPQCPVPGLDWNPTTSATYGRIQIPPTNPYRNFLEAHYGSSYEWIFNINDVGKVKTR